MYSEPLSAVGSKKVKTVKIKRSRSVAGAAEFMRKMKQLSILDAVLPARGSLVSSPALTPLTLTTGAAPTGVTSPKKRKRKYPSWWRVFIKRNPMLFGRDRYPIAWEDAPPILRLEFYHWALTLMGQVYAFTLNLRNSVEDEAKDQRKPCDWLHRRMALRLKEALGRKVMMVSCFEEVGEDRRRLHVHGYFIVNDNELEKAEAALCIAGGEWGPRRLQVKCGPNTPDEGWASYVGKQIWKASPSLTAKFRNPDFLTDYTSAAGQRRGQPAGQRAIQ